MTHQDLALSIVRALPAFQHPRERTRPAPGVEAEGLRAFTVTISREAGARGHSVAVQVSRRLSWPVYDQEALDQIAGEIQQLASSRTALAEPQLLSLESWLSDLARSYRLGTDSYLRHLAAAVLGLGARGQCVLLGRGASFILPAATTLRVRLVASAEDRGRALSDRYGLSPADAAAWMATTDRHRTELILKAFRQDITDPHHYDLVLNLSQMSVEDGADVIVHVLRRKERSCLQAEAVPDRSPALVAPE